MNQIAELAALLAKATNQTEARAAELNIYHARKARDEQHKLTVNLLLAQIATLKDLRNADDEKLGKLANEADEKIEIFAQQEEAV